MLLVETGERVPTRHRVATESVRKSVSGVGSVMSARHSALTLRMVAAMPGVGAHPVVDEASPRFVQVVSVHGGARIVPQGRDLTRARLVRVVAKEDGEEDRFEEGERAHATRCFERRPERDRRAVRVTHEMKRVP
jgi:hypothetical protein